MYSTTLKAHINSTQSGRARAISVKVTKRSLNPLPCESETNRDYVAGLVQCSGNLFSRLNTSRMALFSVVSPAGDTSQAMRSGRTKLSNKPRTAVSLHRRRAAVSPSAVRVWSHAYLVCTESAERIEILTYSAACVCKSHRGRPPMSRMPPDFVQFQTWRRLNSNVFCMGGRQP